MKIILFALTGAIIGFLILMVFLGDVDDSGWKYALAGALGGVVIALLPLSDKHPPNMKIRTRIAAGIFILSFVLGLVCLVASATLQGMEALGPLLLGLPFCGLLVAAGFFLMNPKISTRVIVLWSVLIAATAAVLLTVYL